MKKLTLLSLIITLMLATGCTDKFETDESRVLLVETGAYPNIYEHAGQYYFIFQKDDRTINLHSSSDLSSLGESKAKLIYGEGTDSLQHIWSPEISRIDDKWYIYFEGDDGNTDNHHIYVLENGNDDPMTGNWTLHGPIITDPDWNYGIHPSSIVVKGRQYLLWSGWPHRRAETETQCIYIAEMENPWTLRSPRVMISSPDYEWERQWINPDGSRSAYPIFVNENPEPFLSPDGRKIIVGYSASGIWTFYNSLGFLTASVDSNLLDPESWYKNPEPQFKNEPGDSTLYGTSNISVLTTGDLSRVVYQGKSFKPWGEHNSIFVKPIEWDESSLPVFGSPR